MRVILDCNIWVSFLIGHKLDAMRKILATPSVEVYSCPQLVAELIDVVRRDKIRRHVKDSDTEDLLRIIRAYCKTVDPKATTATGLRDAKDLYLLALAETVEADCLVSGDADLLVLGHHKGTRMMRLAEFLGTL
ncbi:MAG: putative toxin-antitoxin system toxin component, PIN family [Bacteroidales bacterium]|nr:putative toxin-antitoxin system toxin component, PIN family [Bacteroidales bacterium]